MSLAILGAGKLGTAVAGLAVGHGLPVSVATSRAPELNALILEVLAPGARALSVADALTTADLVLLAIPLRRVPELDPAALAGKVVIDATNYWWETDGMDPALRDATPSTSEMVQRHLAGAIVVKGFNHIGYHDLAGLAQPAGAPGRIAMAVAGDEPHATGRVAELVDILGFDPIVLDSLHAGRALEPGHEAFGAAVPRALLEPMLGDPDAPAVVEGPTP